MSRPSSIQEKPKSLIYLMSHSSSYNVETENLFKFYEQFKDPKSIWYLKNMFYSTNLKKDTDSLVYYWSLQFLNIQIVYSYGSNYIYCHHPNGKVDTLLNGTRTNGLVIKRPDNNINKSNLELHIYKLPRIKTYFLEWILPNNLQFNPDYFITDYHYYLQAIQWLFNNLGLEPIVPSRYYATNDRYIKFQKDTYTYNKQPIPFLEDLHKNNPQYIELNQKLEKILIDNTQVKVKDIPKNSKKHIQRYPLDESPSINGGKKKAIRKVK